MKEKITIPFYNDLLFKYFVYDNEDEGCQYILKKIIEEITPIRCKELYVINSELMTHHYREKRSILDVRVKTQISILKCNQRAYLKVCIEDFNIMLLKILLYK